MGALSLHVAHRIERLDAGEGGVGARVVALRRVRGERDVDGSGVGYGAERSATGVAPYAAITSLAIG